MKLLKRRSDSHKGSNGIVVVVGGSEIYTGAPIFTSMAAYKSGVDLVYTCTPRRAADAAAAYSPEIITVPLLGKFFDSSHIQLIEGWLEKADVLAIGPGLGKEKYTAEACRKLISKCEIPMVIDADALKALAGHLSILKKKDIVLTPHRSEFEIISEGMRATEENVQQFTAKIQANFVVTLLKAPVDIITDGKKTKKCKFGCAAMTIGGTGDVLTGIVAGLIAQKVPLFDAAYYAACVNGRAGELCYKERGYGMITSDMFEKIPGLIKKLS